MLFGRPPKHWQGQKDSMNLGFVATYLQYTRTLVDHPIRIDLLMSKACKTLMCIHPRTLNLDSNFAVVGTWFRYSFGAKGGPHVLQQFLPIVIRPLALRHPKLL